MHRAMRLEMFWKRGYTEFVDRWPFFSKQLRPPEHKYSAFDKELLGLYLANHHFRFFLEGRLFSVFTDHKPLLGAMSKLSDPSTPRQQLHLTYISEFSTDIQLISGKANKEIANQLGVTLHRTTPYHPQSNGLIERPHRTLKAAHKARLQGPNWVDKLPWVLLGLRSSPKLDLGSSSAEQVYGHPLTVSGQFTDHTFRSHNSNVNDPVNMTIRRFSPVPTSNHRWHPQSAASIPQSIQNAKFVFVRRDAHRGPLQRSYNGPFQVVAPGPKTFRIRTGDNEETVSVDRLKPAHTDPAEPVNVAQPPRHGKPPMQHEPVITEVPDDSPSHYQPPRVWPLNSPSHKIL
ncbi:Pol polyprotein [Elysia marginata]|uniref:Pol polyprotein n=1 Tax=Elysia marginata TaxID=1093978 RepID=A0AAV4EGR1_9GAST|nr:Pol polyprotein [Elysia marginata]